MSAITERDTLINLANEMRDAFKTLHSIMWKINAALHAEADSLKLDAADEADDSAKLRTRRLVYSGSKPVATEPSRPPILPKLAPGKRACSNCRQPGHRSTTCPQPKKKT